MLDRNRPSSTRGRRARGALDHAAHDAARAAARRELLLIVPLTVATIVAYVMREELFGSTRPCAWRRRSCWWSSAGRSRATSGAGSSRRCSAASIRARPGRSSFLIRLSFLALAALAALRIAGLDPRTLAVGGAITAVVFGLAAQQTLGNLIAGMVLISARPFRIGDRVRLQGGGAGRPDRGHRRLARACSTSPSRRARTRSWSPTTSSSPRRSCRCASPPRSTCAPGCAPTSSLRGPGAAAARRHDPVRAEPHISLEEIDSEEVVVRIAATPESEEDGPRLADEVLSAIASVTREGDTDERMAARRETRPRAWKTGRTRAGPPSTWPSGRAGALLALRLERGAAAAHSRATGSPALRAAPLDPAVDERGVLAHHAREHERAVRRDLHPRQRGVGDLRGERVGARLAGTAARAGMSPRGSCGRRRTRGTPPAAPTPCPSSARPAAARSSTRPPCAPAGAGRGWSTSRPRPWPARAARTCPGFTLRGSLIATSLVRPSAAVRLIVRHDPPRLSCTATSAPVSIPVVLTDATNGNPRYARAGGATASRAPEPAAVRRNERTALVSLPPGQLRQLRHACQ